MPAHPQPGAVADHPRACGENVRHTESLPAPAGSPPRMRGKPWTRETAPERERITPAHAGKTTMKSTFTDLDSDHPRACGENAHTKGAHYEKHGSPPRMRGKPALAALRLCDGRITPAHAGKTPSASSPAPCPSDHPRACGENVYVRQNAPTMPGSPPRMRGKPHAVAESKLRMRITPAHAGKTKSRSMA